VPLPLTGLKILELGTLIAAPFAARMLGEFGADVVKVEAPGEGDPLRKWRKMHGDTSLWWYLQARNKKSVGIDLKTPEGQRLVRRLAADADVLIENFRPGKMESWGLGWETLHTLNPRLVMVRISAYGQDGPYKGRPGFGRIANAFGGISYLAGYPDRAPVTPGSATLPDYMSGLYGALGALLALRTAEHTGVGQIVDIGLYEPIFRVLDELAPAYAYRGYVRERMGPATVNVVPHSHYPTVDGKWVAIACTNDKIFARFAAVAGEPELAGSGKWGTIAQREAARAEVDAWTTAWTSRHSRDEILALCDEGQVPCGPLLSIDEIFDDPQYAARQNIARVPHPKLGEVAVPNVVPRLTETPGTIRSLGPELGADTDRILSEILGRSAAEISALKAGGIV